MTRSSRYLATACCAAGAGAHAALVPSHLAEGADALVVAFVTTAALLAVLAVAAGRPEHDRWALPGVVIVLAATAVAYVLSRTTGIAGLVAGPEAVDPAGVLLTCTEALGALAGVTLLIQLRRQPR